MRQLLHALWVTSLQCTSLFLAGIGSCFTSAATSFHILCQQYAVRYDNKYALKPSEASPTMPSIKLDSMAMN